MEYRDWPIKRYHSKDHVRLFQMVFFIFVMGFFFEEKFKFCEGGLEDR